MSDPRTTPDPALVAMDEPARIIVPIVDLTRGIDTPRDRQLVYGEDITILNRIGDHCLIRADKDGYCGTVPAAASGPSLAATHKVTALATHAYEKPDFKSRDREMLPFGARVAVLSETERFVETERGFIPRQHLQEVGYLAKDPATIASIFLGAPYLWGGNTPLGIDCSGLVQAALLACGMPCPADSDQQQTQLGITLSADETLDPNDLVFWKGHVAIVTDKTTLIHANAGHMSVAYEPIDEALVRIEAQGDGLPTRRARLAWPDA